MASALHDCIRKASLANGGDLAMRYERLSDIVRLAIRLQGLRRGMTIADIQQEFDISRRTAERLRNAVTAGVCNRPTCGSWCGARECA